MNLFFKKDAKIRNDLIEFSRSQLYQNISESEALLISSLRKSCKIMKSKREYLSQYCLSFQGKKPFFRFLYSNSLVISNRIFFSFPLFNINTLVIKLIQTSKIQMILRPPTLHQEQDNLSHVISQSDARQSSKSRNKIKKKQNSLSFRNKPIVSNNQIQERERQDNGSVHSHASGRSKKSKTKQSSIGLKRPRGGHLLNSPRKSQEDDIEVMNYADGNQERGGNVKSYGIQYSDVKRDYAHDYSPNVYQNRSPNIEIKPSFKNVLTNFEYEKQPSFKQDQDDQIPVVKLVEAKGKNQVTPKYNTNMQNVVSPKIAQRKQTRKLGQLFEENRRNINQLGVSAVPSQINNSSLVGQSRRSRSKLGQLFRQKSRQKQVSNNSRVQFTQNSSLNFQASVSDINQHIDSSIKPGITRSKEKLIANKNNLPEKVLEKSTHEFDPQNMSELNLSMSRNSPMVSKYQTFNNSNDGNKDSVCFNIEPEREKRKKGINLASKKAQEQEEEMIQFSGEITSKQIQPRSFQNSGNTRQQDAHERLKMNLKQNEKYLIESGVMGVSAHNDLRQQEQRRRKDEEARKRQQYLREVQAAEERKRQERILFQQKKADEIRVQQENLRRQEQKRRQDLMRQEADKKKQNQRIQMERKQIAKRKQQQRKQQERKQKQRKMEQRLKEEQQQNQRIRMEEEQAERRRRQKQLQREKLRQKAEEQRKLNVQRQRQRQEEGQKRMEQEKLRQQQQAKRQRQRIKNAYKSQQRKIKQSSQRSLVYELENQSVNQSQTNRKDKKNQLQHIPSSYSLQQSSRDSSKSKQSRKSTRKKQGVIPSKNRKVIIGDASPRAEESFYEQRQQEKVQKKSQPVEPVEQIESSQAPRKLMSFQEQDDLTYQPKNQYKTDTYFYDRSSKAYSKPPLSKKSSSKSKPKQSSIKKQTKDSQIKMTPVVHGKPPGEKKLSLVELAMKKNYEPQSGSDYQSQDSFRSRQNSVNSSGSRNSRNSAGSKKKQSTIKLQKPLNHRPPLYHKSSSQNQNGLMSRTSQHEKQMSSRQKYGETVQREQKAKVIKGCSFIDERGRLVQNGNMIVRGAEISGSTNRIGGLTQQKFAQKLMKSRQKRRSKSRQRSLERSRASSRSIEKGNSRYDLRGQTQYAESEAYEQSQYSQQDRRYDTSGANFYGTRNDQSFYQNSVSRNNFTNKNQRNFPQNLQQFIKPIQQAGIGRQYQNPRNQPTYPQKQSENITKKRIMQRRTQKPRGY